ncbi:hypothetical protein Scep_027134 [Stephania cephalantha]|uniref:F-box domain-containing protein n=1 Tax=Stephania cephalantha TaxID=152367 RepID=A0AAP0ELG1_9MAGN
MATTTTTTTTTCSKKKKKKVGLDSSSSSELIPGLPEHLAEECLSRVHPRVLYKVCHSWRRLIYSPTFPPFLSLYALLASSSSSSSSVLFSTYDPISSTWVSLPLPLPPPPPPPPPLLHRPPPPRPVPLPLQPPPPPPRRHLPPPPPPALPRPLLFSPASSHWLLGPPISPPRRWCAAGSLHNSVYLASGFSSSFNHLVARSASRWTLPNINIQIPSKNLFQDEEQYRIKVESDNHFQERDKEQYRIKVEADNNLLDDEVGGRWEEVAGMRDAAFSREAAEAVGWRGKLCMVNVKGNAVKVGVVYDERKGAWEEMREGMLRGGWGRWRRWMRRRCTWWMRGGGDGEMAAGGGRLCVVCRGGSGVLVVDVAPRPGRVWVVDPPPGNSVIAVHVLPRISTPPPPPTTT